MQININTVFPFGYEHLFLSQRYLEMLYVTVCINICVDKYLIYEVCDESGGIVQRC